MAIDAWRALGDHLWQTTLFGIVAAALGLLLRKAPARVRSGIWLAASLKFLVPFSLLIAMGSLLAPTHRANASLEPASLYSVDTFSQPFTYAPGTIAVRMPGALETSSRNVMRWVLIGGTILWLAGMLAVLGAWARAWRRVGAALKSAQLAVGGGELVALRRLEAAIGMERPIPLLLSESALEPGIVGVLKPKLVWPRRISETLSEEQIRAILAHEVAHVQRRDNLAAVLHMVVEAVFWWHPLVWWLGKRMIDERERACDEAVVLLGNAPETYAEAILRACRFSIESPLACVAGISGAELKQRIQRIVAGEPVRVLGRGRRAALGGLGAAAILIPVVFGFVDAPRVSAGLEDQPAAAGRFSFEVATVKPGDQNATQRSLLMLPGKLTVQNMPFKMVIMFAFDAKSDSQISGLPDWVNSATYSIEAKEDAATAAALDKLPRDERTKQVQLMLQALLADRFHLKVSHVAKELPVYALVVVKGGPKLKETPVSAANPAPAPDPLPAPGTPPKLGKGMVFMRPGQVEASEMGMDMLASGILSRMPEVGDRVVVDKTGLTGKYDFTLKWTPENAPAPRTPEADNGTPKDDAPPGLFTALEEQLGLKLEAQKGSVETLVVDSIDRPTPN
ncbi:MAG: M56 family metallopeptidase [Terracidiphilus sp.]